MRPRNAGMSLVELIVCIGIMLIMMSILLPAACKLVHAVHALGK